MTAHQLRGRRGPHRPHPSRDWLLLPAGKGLSGQPGLSVCVQRVPPHGHCAFGRCPSSCAGVREHPFPQDEPYPVILIKSHVEEVAREWDWERDWRTPVGVAEPGVSRAAWPHAHHARPCMEPGSQDVLVNNLRHPEHTGTWERMLLSWLFGSLLRHTAGAGGHLWMIC